MRQRSQPSTPSVSAPHSGKRRRPITTNNRSSWREQQNITPTPADHVVINIQDDIMENGGPEDDNDKEPYQPTTSFLSPSNFFRGRSTKSRPSALPLYTEHQPTSSPHSGSSFGMSMDSLELSGRESTPPYAHSFPTTTTKSPDHHDYNRSAAWKPQPQYALYPPPRLQDVHTVYRQPHHVPDSEYHRRMTGIPALHSTSDHTQTCLQFCSLFSGIATFFLFFIGFLLDAQPLYIPGTLPILPIQSTVSVNGVALTKLQYQYLIPGSTAEERLPTALTAYRTAWLYAATTLVCLWWHRRRDQQYYRAVPDAVLPMTTAGASTQHEDSVWQRAVGAVQRRWMTWRRRRRRRRTRERSAKPRME